MNLRNVLRAYGLLRQLSDDESALLNILRALNDNDRDQLVASMSDKPQKKSSKKAGGGGKSKWGESIKKQLINQRQEQQSIPLCTYVSDDGDDPTQCGEAESSGIHDATMGYRNYHEFVAPPASSAAGASGGD